jgi:hypothetical protein
MKMADEFDLNEDMGSTSKRSGTSKLRLEGIIPIVIIIIVVLLIAFKTNIFSGSSEIFSGKGSAVLIIGSPSPNLQLVLNNAENKDLIKEKRQITMDALLYNPTERIKGYDVIILDQSLSADKSITRTAGEAIASFVKSGGSLMVVLNSGIERPGDPSVIGWKPTFGDIIPVSCDPTLYSTPSCKQQLRVNGVLYANRYNSKQGAYKIMYGIEKVPALESTGLISTETYPVTVNGNEIAYLVDSRTGTYYPAIVEKPLLLGKVIYFNYDPGLSETIFVNTLKYLS